MHVVWFMLSSIAYAFEFVVGKRRVAVVLTPKGVLADQQALKFEEDCLAQWNVKCFRGHLNVTPGSWQEEEWREELEDQHILVMTPEVLYRLFVRGYIRMHNICILVVL